MTGAQGLTGASLVILLDPHALKADSLKIHKKKVSKYWLVFSLLFLQRPHVVA